MKPSEYKAFVKWSIVNKLKKPICLVGLRGVGKSQIIKQVAEELNMHYIDLRLAQMEPGDIIGMPYIDNEKTKWARPSWLPEEGDYPNGVVLVWEEFNRAQRDVRHCAFQGFTENRIHEHVFPSNMYQFGAINPDNGNNQVDELDEAFVRRFCFVQAESDFDDFKKYTEKDMYPDLMEFLTIEKRFLNKQDNFKIPDRSYSPASWYDQGVNLYLKAGIHKQNDFDWYEPIAGLVGDEAAQSLKQHMLTKRTPLTGEEIAKGWNDVMAERFKKQKNDEIAFTVDNVSEYYNSEKRKWQEERVINIMRFWQTLPPEYAVSFLKKVEKSVLVKHFKKDDKTNERKFPEGAKEFKKVADYLANKCGVDIEKN